MRRSELTDRLRQPYSDDRGYGISKVDKPGYENIWFVVPPPPPLDLRVDVPLQTLRDANLALETRPRLTTASESECLLAYLLMNQEAVSSSRMEGTWSTIDDVLSPRSDDSARAETESVRGYAHALAIGIDAVSDQGPTALDRDLICDTHSRIMRRDPGFTGVAGQIRHPGSPRDVVQIGAIGRKEDALYNPAPPAHVERCLAGVLGWLTNRELIDAGDAGMGLSLPLRLAIGHSHFEAVHPFSDGNGRVGRVLWALQMAASNRLPLYLSGYVEAERDEYSRALQEAQKQLDYNRVIEFVCKAITTCAAEEHATKQALSVLPDTWRQRGKFRANSSAARALALLTAKPILTAKQLSVDLGVSLRAALDGLAFLEEAKIVRERSGRQRGRVFAAEEVTHLLSRSFATDPEDALDMARRTLRLE